MEKQIKIEYQSGYLLCERRNPINGEYWVYISPKEWETKEDIIPTKANNPCGWFDKLHDQENYYTIVGTFVNGYAFEQEQSQAANAAVQGYREALEKIESISPSQSRQWKIANAALSKAEDETSVGNDGFEFDFSSTCPPTKLPLQNTKAEDKGEEFETSYGEVLSTIRTPIEEPTTALDELERWVKEFPYVMNQKDILSKIQSLKTITT